MSERELLDALKRLIPSQFEEVLFHYNIPAQNLPPGAQTERAIIVIRYAQGRNECAQLRQAIEEVAGTNFITTTSPSSTADLHTLTTTIETDSNSDNEPPKVLISYSHDSAQHKDLVLKFSNQLCEDGIDCTIDQYLNGSPPEGWVLWMEKQIEESDFVLMMCTPTYLKRFRREDKGAGRGVTFEGLVITQHLYDNYFRNTKFIPLIPDHGNADKDVPTILKSYNTYRISSDYEKLYRILTGQPEVLKPSLGSRKRLPSRNPN